MTNINILLLVILVDNEKSTMIILVTLLMNAIYTLIAGISSMCRCVYYTQYSTKYSTSNVRVQSTSSYREA